MFTGTVLSLSFQSYQPDRAQMSQFMNQSTMLVAAFVHACYLLRCSLDTDPEFVVNAQDCP